MLDAELGERAGFAWTAVAFALGCLLYFSLPREPPLVPLFLAGSGAVVLATIRYGRGQAWQALALVAAVLAGMAAAKIRVASLDGPGISRTIVAYLAGRVVAVEEAAGRRPRVVLDGVRRGAGPPDGQRRPEPRLPARLRISLPPAGGVPALGENVAVKARLGPISGPAVPGGYDPRRAAFFEGVRASGFALGPWRSAAPASSLSPSLAIERLRAAAVDRIRAAEPGEAGAMAAALMVGDRSGLSDETNEAMRASGLAHILSISGLHMMLVAGTAFLTVRALLALSPRLALSRPIRQWAAAVALVAVTVYFALSGGGAATLRSYVMAAVMLAAILIGRTPISLRNLALAAFVVLALEPESVVEPGFQMSFAAVAALVAGWRAWHDRPRQNLAEPDALPGGWVLAAAGRLVLGVAGTSLLAGLATAPYAAYHFERIAAYSLIGNLIAAPVVSILIMPFGLAALVALPFGLEAAPLWVMGRGVDLLVAIAGFVAGLPGAEMAGPDLPGVSLLLITAGLLWLCLWRLRWRLFGILPIAAGLLLAAAGPRPPDLLVSPDGRAVAVRDASGVLRVAGAKPGSYLADQLGGRLADDTTADEASSAAAQAATPGDPAASEKGGCDALGCRMATADGRFVALVRDALAFTEDCRRAAVVVSALDAPADCEAALVLDGGDLREGGAQAVRFGAGGTFAVESELTGPPRPWQATGTAER